MEKEFLVMYETVAEISSVRFKLEDPIRCGLSFSSNGIATLEIPDCHEDEMRQFGLHLLVADELKVDLTQLEVKFSVSDENFCDTMTSHRMINTIRKLCLCANLYFKERAAFYWGVMSSQCRITNLNVLSHRYKIAYKQLIEIDSTLFNNSQTQ